MIWTGNYGVELSMTRPEALSMCPQGADAEPAIRTLLGAPRFQRQFAKLDEAKIRQELLEYGAWDDEELKDDAQNQVRLMWIAAGYIKEGLR